MESLTYLIVLGVVITIALATAYWMQSTTLSQTHSLEILDITKSYTKIDGQDVELHIVLHNRGTEEAVITEILVNNKPTGKHATIEPGEEKELTLRTQYRPGLTIKVDLISSRGNTYTVTFQP